MCLGEGPTDTLHASELMALQRSAAERLPGYGVEARDNGRISWAVLEPEARATLPRFTICRIDHCILVMVEEADERRFISVPNVDDAVLLARRTVLTATARRNVHQAPEMAQ